MSDVRGTGPQLTSTVKKRDVTDEGPQMTSWVKKNLTSLARTLTDLKMFRFISTKIFYCFTDIETVVCVCAAVAPELRLCNCRPDICHEYHELYSWKKISKFQLSMYDNCWEIENFSTCEEISVQLMGS